MSESPASAPAHVLHPDDRLAQLVAEGARSLSGAAPQEILAWTLGTIGRGNVAIVTSFQLEGMAVLDMAWRIDPSVQVITVDSGRLPQATLDLVDEVRTRYGMTVEVLYPDAAEISELVTRHGVNLFYQSPELRISCCEVRKVRPLNRRLATLDGWITGLRRTQNARRADVAEVEMDARGLVKVNPLAGWNDAQLDGYLREHDVPRNALYTQGYTSIGCEPCTRPTSPGEDPRAGRWWWERGDTECGIHYRLDIADDGTEDARIVARADPVENAATAADKIDPQLKNRGDAK